MRIRRISGVLCSGNICFDILVRPVDCLEWGTSTWVEEYLETMGGNGSNTSYTLAMLGVPVRLHGMVGPDAYGDHVLAKLQGGPGRGPPLAGADDHDLSLRQRRFVSASGGPWCMYLKEKDLLDIPWKWHCAQACLRLHRTLPQSNETGPAVRPNAVFARQKKR